MIRTTFAAIGAAALALSACSSGNDDALNTAEVNAADEDLNAMAGDAATNAATAEAVALGTQEQQLEQEDAAAPATTPTDADEQNVAGM